MLNFVKNGVIELCCFLQGKKNLISVIELKDYLVFVGFGYCIIISFIEIELVCWFFIKEFIIRLIEDKLFIRVRWFFIFDYVKLKFILS